MGKHKPGKGAKAQRSGRPKSYGRTPKKKCCQKSTRCSRCPIRMLAEGTLPVGLTVKRRRLVTIGTEARDVRPVTMLRAVDAPTAGRSFASTPSSAATQNPVKLGKKARKKAAKRARKLAAAA